MFPNNPKYYLNPTGTFPALDIWVDDFTDWALGKLDIFYVDGLNATSSASKGVWVEYNWDGAIGIYAIRKLNSLKDLIYMWLRANQLQLSVHNVKEALARLESLVHRDFNEFDRYDPLEPFINCIDGLWYPITRELLPHTPNSECLNQIPCNFLFAPSKNKDPRLKMAEDFRTLVHLEKLMPCWMSMRKHYPQVMDKVERYAQMVLYQDIKHKMLLYVIGGANSGKGTIGHVLAEIFSTVASYQPLVELNEKWGLMPLIGKKVNFDLDSGMGELTRLGLGRLKTIIGDPGKPYSTPIIYAGSKDVIFSPFFFTFSNQLQTLPANVDRKAWGKRALCLIMDKTFQDDESFEENIMKETDLLFTYLCLKPYNPIRREEYGGFEKFVSRNLRIWDVWSDPVRKILIECFERSYDLDDIFLVSDVEKMILEIMDDREITPEKDFEKSIRKTFKRMGVTSVKRKVDRATVYCYLGMKVKHTPVGIPNIYSTKHKDLHNNYGVVFTDMEAIDNANAKDKTVHTHEVEVIEMEKTKPIKKLIIPSDAALTFAVNKKDPIFAFIITLSKEYPNYGLEFEDLWEPLKSQGLIKSRQEIRDYVQKMIKSDLVFFNNETNHWQYQGELK